MAKISRDQAIAQLNRSSKQNTLLAFAWQCERDREWAPVHYWQESAESSYGFYAARLDSAHGGLLSVRFHHDGQKDNSAVYYLDDIASLFPVYDVDGFAYHIRVAAETAQRARYRESLAEYQQTEV